MEQKTTPNLIREIISNAEYAKNKIIPAEILKILLARQDAIESVISLSQDEIDDDRVMEARKTNNALLDILEKFLEQCGGITEEDKERIKPKLNVDPHGPKLRFFKEVSNMLHDCHYQKISKTI